MKNLFIISFCLLVFIGRVYPQPGGVFLERILRSEPIAVYLQRAKEVFRKLNITLTDETKNYIRGIHNQKSVFVGMKSMEQDYPYVEIECTGFPRAIVEKLPERIRELMENKQSVNTVLPLSAIELEVGAIKNNYYSNAYYYDYSIINKPKKISNITDQSPLQIAFSGLPVNADKIVIAKQNSSTDEWINGYEYQLVNGKITQNGIVSNSGTINAPALAKGEYEARILSELRQSNTGKRFRQLQSFSFSVIPDYLSRPHLSVSLLNSNCNDQGTTVDMSVRIYKGANLLEERKPREYLFIHTNTKSKATSRSFSNFYFLLEPGKYDVEFDYHFFKISKKIELVRGKDQFISAGETNGKLTLAFLDEQGMLKTINNCTIIIRSGDNEVFNKKAENIRVESGDLSEGKYTIEISYNDKKITKDFEISHCKETRVDIRIDECKNLLSPFISKALYFGGAQGLLSQDKDGLYKARVLTQLRDLVKEPLSLLGCDPNTPAQKINELINNFNQLSDHDLRLKMGLVHGSTGEIDHTIKESFVDPRVKCNFYVRNLVNLYDGVRFVGYAMGIASFYQAQHQSIPAEAKKTILELLSDAHPSLMKYSNGCMNKLDGSILTMKQVPDDPQELLNILARLDYSIDMQKCCCSCGK